MEKAFVTFGVFRTLLRREKRIELHSDQYGVLHLAFGVSGMDVHSLDMDFGGSGIEILVFKFSDLTSVHRVGVVRTEFLHIELHHTATDFLVGSEADLDFAVFELRMLHDILGGVHDFGDSGFVVSSQKRRSVGRYEGLTDVVEHFRELGRFEIKTFDALKRDVSTVIVLYDLRLDILTRSIGSGIDMGDESYFGDILVKIRRDRTHHITPLVKFSLDAHGVQFFTKHSEKVHFLHGAWLALRLFI